MVLEHEREHPSQWAAITSIAEKIGCTAETLRKWVRQHGRPLLLAPVDAQSIYGGCLSQYRDEMSTQRPPK